jgi:biotin operon repressor
MANHTALRTQLINVLSATHMGAANGISGEALARRLGTDTRTLRSVISEARTEGVAIASTPETGYYIAQTPDELARCCAFLRSRAMHSLSVESRLRGIPMPELLGQLHLPT